MNFEQAIEVLNYGDKIKLPEWVGYWFKEDGKIKVHTMTGDILETPFIEDYKNRTDWVITDGKRDFGGALIALKAGKKVSREGWNGKGLFVFMQVPASIGKEVVPNMQSLPQSVKDEFQRRFDSGDLSFIYYSNQMALVDKSNMITGWAPSSSDSLAEDWVIV